ncbi:MAG: hypothetical protein Q8R28_21560 [Dehalococcoidia bacterium]|nr:hypothetical protein [Dehalococcoidia bacterium]
MPSKQENPGPRKRGHATWKRAFLAVLAECGSIAEATRAAGISPAQVYAARKKDPVFRTSWETALSDAVLAIEAEAHRRALKNSDALIQFLLQKRLPDKYGKGRDEGSGQQPSINITLEGS